MNAPHFLTLAVLSMAAYLIGGLPFGYWFVRLTSGRDIRDMGSGNIGATNVHRAAGGKAGLMVLVLDILKGFLAVWIAALTTHGEPLALALAACAAVLGHCYPAFLNFKGGKAVACFIGAFGFLAPAALALTAVAFFITAFSTRYISLASMVGAFLFPMFLWWMSYPPMPILYASIFAGALVIYRHKGNIDRLRNGTEHVFSFHRKTV